MKKFSHISGRFYETDGAAIYYEGIGDHTNPVILLLHGGLGNMEDFNPVIASLSAHFFIIGADSRGQGRSTLGNVALSYEQLKRDVTGLLKFLHIEAASIIGLGDGGITAYRLAAEGNFKVQKLVTIGADWSTKNLDHQQDLFSKMTAESWKQKFPEAFNRYQQINPEPDFDALITAIKMLWLDDSEMGYPNGLVNKIACPTLIIRGDTDPLFSRASAAELADKIERAALFNIPFAGHEAFKDQPELFSTALHQFLV